jgi:hypothetical protein
MVGRPVKDAGMLRQLDNVHTLSSDASHMSRHIQIRQSFGTRRLVKEDWMADEPIHPKELVAAKAHSFPFRSLLKTTRVHILY